MRCDRSKVSCENAPSGNANGLLIISDPVDHEQDCQFARLGRELVAYRCGRAGFPAAESVEAGSGRSAGPPAAAAVAGRADIAAAWRAERGLAAALAAVVAQLRRDDGIPVVEEAEVAWAAAQAAVVLVTVEELGEFEAVLALEPTVEAVVGPGNAQTFLPVVQPVPARAALPADVGIVRLAEESRRE